MALRLILVSAVAGLGLSLPSAERVQEWRQSARTWVHARLAEWDARMPADEDAFVLVNEPTTTVARATPPAPAPTPTPAPAAPQTPDAAPALAETSAPPAPPAAAATTPAQAPAEELAAGLDIPTVPMALDAAELTPAPAPAPEPEAALAAAPVAAEPEPAAAPEVALDAAFGAAQDDIVVSFTADALAAAEAAPPAAETPAAPALETRVSDELYAEIALALEREAGAFDVPAPVAAAPRFEPMVVDEDLYPGIAYALNREAEGLSAVSPEPAATVARMPAPASAGKNRVSHALRLTREAVSAWASILHGPAIVTLAR